MVQTIPNHIGGGKIAGLTSDSNHMVSAPLPDSLPARNPSNTTSGTVNSAQRMKLARNCPREARAVIESPSRRFVGRVVAECRCGRNVATSRDDEELHVALRSRNGTGHDPVDRPAPSLEPEPHFVAHPLVKRRVAHHSALADLLASHFELRLDQRDEA